MQKGLICVLLITVLSINAQEMEDGAGAQQEDKSDCIKEFLNWCQGMEFPSDDSGMSVISISYYDGQKHARIFCSIDSEGARCMKNRSPWFHCYPNKTLSYKGNQLEENAEGDEEVCESKNSALKFSSGTTFNRTAFDERIKQYHQEIEDFFKEMSVLQEQMAVLQKRLFGDNFNFYNLDGDRKNVIPERPPSDEDEPLEMDNMP